MVQKEVKKKTSIYGTVAVLSAIVLLLWFTFSAQPQQFFRQPNTFLCSGMKTFSSMDELKNYLSG